jgi:hypothetical protein
MNFKPKSEKTLAVHEANQTYKTIQSMTLNLVLAQKRLSRLEKVTSQ